MNDLQIEYFLAVAENLSFTKTATEKYVSQPAISKQIGAMEEELGVILFERSYKSIKLTDAGLLFADYYRKQRQDLSLLTRQAKDIHKRKKVLLRIGCGSGWTMTDFLPGIIENIGLNHPEVKILLESHSFTQLPGALAEDGVDIAIALNSSLHINPSLEIHKLTETPRVIVYSKSHPLARHKELTPIDFKNETFIIPSSNEATHIVEFVKSFCQPYGFTPKIQGVRNNESLILSVLNGTGVAITDLWTVKSGRKGLRYIPLNTNHTIAVAWKRNNFNPAVHMFLKELVKVFYPNGGSTFDDVLR